MQFRINCVSTLTLNITKEYTKLTLKSMFIHHKMMQKILCKLIHFRSKLSWCLQIQIKIKKIEYFQFSSIFEVHVRSKQDDNRLSVVDKIIKFEDKCCSGLQLNQATHLCCDKTFFREEERVQKSKPYHDGCCPTHEGGVTYDSVNFVCTIEYKVEKKLSMLDHKCGTEKYDPKKDLCCNSQLFKGELKDGMSCCHPSASIYNPQKDVCCLGVRKKGKR